MATSNQGDRPGNQPGRGAGGGRSRLWIAFTIGRHLNRLRWLLELAIFSGDALPGGEVDPLLKAFIPKFQGLVGRSAAREPERKIWEQIDSWNGWKGWEYAGDEVSTTIEIYKRRAYGEDVEHFFVDREFDDATQHGRDIEKAIRSAVVATLEGHQSLLEALELGTLVDRGIRPPDSPRYYYRREPIPESPIESRELRAVNPIDRRALEQPDDAPDVGPGSPEDEDEGDDWDQLEALLSSRKNDVPPLGPTRIVRRFSRTADAPLSPEWALDLREAWDRMGLSHLAPLPEAIFLFHERPSHSGREARGIAGAVIKAARQGFRLVEASPGRSSVVIEARSGTGTADMSVSESRISSKDPESPTPEELPPDTSCSQAEGSNPATALEEVPRRKRRVRSKEPIIPGPEAERRVADYLQKCPDAGPTEISLATGVPKGSVSGTPAYKKANAMPGGGKSRSPRTRNLRTSSMDSFGKYQDIIGYINLMYIL